MNTPPNQTLQLLPAGLENTIVDKTAISTELPTDGLLLYRGYSVNELAEHCSYDEIAYLLLYGERPHPADLRQWHNEENSLRALPPRIIEAIETGNSKAHPMDRLRTVISILGELEATTLGPEKQLLSIIAKAPVILAALTRVSQSADIIAPREELCWTDNFLYCLFADLPSKEVRMAFDKLAILYAENAFAPSTFTARVIASTVTDCYGPIIGALSSLKGQLHGGANELALSMILEVGSIDNVDSWYIEKTNRKQRLMGFGHRVFRAGDPRVATMSKYRDLLADHLGRNELTKISNAIASKIYAEKHLRPNIDFPASVLLHLIGFPTEIFTPVFAISRMVGWAAHILEQRTNNKLYNPLAQYIGHPHRPLEQ